MAMPLVRPATSFVRRVKRWRKVGARLVGATGKGVDAGAFVASPGGEKEGGCARPSVPRATSSKARVKGTRACIKLLFLFGLCCGRFIGFLRRGRTCRRFRGLCWRVGLR